MIDNKNEATNYPTDPNSDSFQLKENMWMQKDEIAE